MSAVSGARPGRRSSIDLLLAAEPAHIRPITQVLVELGSNLSPCRLPGHPADPVECLPSPSNRLRVHVHVVPAASPGGRQARLPSALRADPLFQRR